MRLEAWTFWMRGPAGPAGFCPEQGGKRGIHFGGVPHTSEKLELSLAIGRFQARSLSTNLSCSKPDLAIRRQIPQEQDARLAFPFSFF